jgi:hypothetical protein
MADTFTVSRSTTIDAAPAAVYPHLIDLRKWSTWSPWEEMDPNMSKTYSGAESGIGSKYAWSGNRKVGEGTMEITDAKQDAQVDIALEFLKPFRASNTSSLRLQPAGGGTEVTWSVTGRKTLMLKIMGIFRSMDAMMGPDFERGLARLKAVSEQ